LVHAGRRFEVLVLLAYVLFVTLLSAYHEPWLDETQAWRLAIDTDGIADLYRSSRYEGHPLLFHVVLQLIGHVSRSWWAAVAFHVAVAGLAAWLVLRYAPFTRLQKALLVFGYFPAYEYAVIVRPYGLGMMLAFAACAVWTATRRRTVWAAVLLVLLANSTAMGMLVALTLALAFAVDWLWPDGDVARRSLRTHGAWALLASVAAVVVLWIVKLQLATPRDAGFIVKPKVEASRYSLWQIGSIPTVELRALFPLSMVENGVVDWTHWLFRPESSRDLAMLLAASAIVLALGCLIAARRRAALAFYLVGTTGFIAFFTLFLTGAARHHGHLFIVWVVTAWIAWSGSPSEWWRLPKIPARAEAIGRRLFTCSLVIPVLGTIEYAVADLRDPFADARNGAAAIRAEGLQDVPIIGRSRPAVQPLAALLDRKVIYPVEGKTLSFIEWGPRRPDGLSEGASERVARDLLARECRVLMVAGAASTPPLPTEARARAIYTTRATTITRDRYRVWLLSAPASERCPAARR
jgi:hypothetical protein